MKTSIISIIGLFVYCIATVSAEEVIAENNSSETITPQPPIVDALTDPVYEPAPIAEDLNERQLEPSDSSPESIAAQTPQPPIVDAVTDPVYEPTPLAEDLNERQLEPGNSLPESIAAPTPQPPIVDEVAEPVYEPNPDTEDLSETPDETPQAPPESEATSISSDTTKWSDTRPQKVSADWLQLTSGEWLRGSIIIMQKDKLEFDSDELDELEIKWEKVKYIKSSEPYSLRFDKRERATGAIEITPDKIYVNTDYDSLEFNRNELLSIATGKETEVSKWKNKITFSFNVRRGNTDQTDFTSKMSAKRRTTDSRLLIDYLGNFTEVEETKTINNHRINATYDIFLSRNLFLTLVSAEFFRDPFQNIEQRNNIGVAVGYTLINTNITEWDVSGGPAYQDTKFSSVQAGEPSTDSTATLVLSTKFDTELNSKVDLEGSYSVTLGDEKTGGYTHHSILTIETEITDKLDFDVSGVWDRVKEPVQAEDGSIPQQDDFRILIGLGYDL